MPPDRPEGVWAEIERLRNWRHEVASVLAARTLLLDSLRGRLDAAEGRLTKLEAEVGRIAKADEIADALRGVIWKAVVALGASIVGAATIAGVVASILFH